jgi:hypothetical protein
MTDTPEAAETPEARKGYPAKASLFWMIVNLGLPALVLVTGGITSGWVIVVSYGIILLANIPLSWSLSRGRILPCIGIYLGSVLIGFSLTFVGCLMTFRLGINK